LASAEVDLTSTKTRIQGDAMTEAAEKLKAQLAALPEDDREALAYYLISTLPDEVVSEDEWEAELMRRDHELSRGEVQEIPAEEVFREIRENRE
jgi:putative addiction module component (TIGR02574 family)